MLYIRSVSCHSINPFKVSYFLSFSAFQQYYVTVTLCVKCPNKEFSLVRIFPPSEHRKIWTRKTPYLDTFHTVLEQNIVSDSNDVEHWPGVVEELQVCFLIC